ncbi:maleylpyruvate isomerase family mycothiol-dependent enzyme [Kitasatospora sp. NPDC001261]|uniref:maleylpyruvate isomerase family mycothiol-dependent enzyme n=1 Tax=Kitasatospora sp. NPDC001261 TaxID=3364012 RepID=UPI003692FAC4
MNTRHQQDEAPPEPLWDRAPDWVAYRRSRRNITELLLAARPGAAGVPVPACPGWTVLDLLGHLVEVCRTVAADVPGNLWEVPHAESGTGLAGLLEEWSRLDGPVERVLSDTPQLRHTMMMMDAFTHELDLRGALRAPVVADQPSYPSALDLVVRGFANSVRSHGLPALRIRTAGAEWQAGDGEPAAVLQGHRHDLLRSLTGRRTVEQVSGLAWSAAPDAWLPAFTWGPFRPPERPVEAAVAAR